jgi:type IV pilus assembly protein PilZ
MSSSSDGRAEQRVDPRAAIELRVEYKRLNTFFADYTKNISKGGTFIKTKKPLDVGTEFIFKLAVPSLAAPLELRGQVKWVVPEENAGPGQSAGMGIRFIYASDAERERIEETVERLMVESLGYHLSSKLLGKQT